MNIYYSKKFAREYKKLPLKVKKAAEGKEAVFRNNPLDASLKTHKLTGRLKDFWSLSINYKYRIIFEFAKKDEIWLHSVGSHAIYDILSESF